MSQRENFYLSSLHLVPWIGIVEKRINDPLKVGCCKVRVFGDNTADIAQEPTDSLPDAYPMLALNGGPWSTPKEGETVFGVYLDANKQQLLMLGIVPAQLQSEVNHPEGVGYKDARSDEELAASPRQEIQSFSYSPNGIKFTEFSQASRYPPHKSGSTTPFLSKNLTSTFPSQIDPTSWTQRALNTRYNSADGSSWYELPTKYEVVYPFNHAYESESLHVMEFDDSPGAERVTLKHRLGSGIEYFPDGSSVRKVVTDDYEVTLGRKYIGISGDATTHIKGNARLLIDGDFIHTVKGDYFLTVNGSYKKLIHGDEVTNTLGSSKSSVGGEQIIKAGGTLWLKGSPLHENSSETPDVPELHDFDLPDLPAQTLSFQNQQALINAVGTIVALNDDKDEVSPNVAGDLAANNITTPQTIICPVVNTPLQLYTNGDVRYRQSISEYFQVADLSIRCVYPHHIEPQCGLQQADIVCNLAFLSKNILDPIFAKFPGMRVNCGFRKFEKGKSQHERGEAADLQWPGIQPGNLSKYLEIATWIKENLPFDQLILEHGNTIWLHVSCKRLNGPNRKQVLTMYNSNYTAGLNMFGRT